MSTMNALDRKNALCCACLREDAEPLHSLNVKYSEEEPELSLQVVLTQLSGVDMVDEDNSPRALCDACLELTRACYRFRKLCQESHRLLQERLHKRGQHDESKGKKLKLQEKHNTDCPKITKSSKTNATNKRKPKGTTKAQERLYGAALWQPASCSECSALLENVPALLAHRATRHRARFQCLHCGAGLTTSRGLEIHLRRHSGARPEVCSTCGATFSDPRTLEMHERRHAGTLRHVCPLCGRGYPARAPLRRHLAAHHSHQAPHTAARALLSPPPV